MSASLVAETASFSEDEEDLLIKLHALLGNRYAVDVLSSLVNYLLW
jgi:hypothetical protein